MTTIASAKLIAKVVYIDTVRDLWLKALDR